MEFTILDAYHIVAAVSILLGFLAAFFGCRIFRLFLALSGFIIVGLFGFVVVYYFISPNIIAGTVVGSVLAIVGSVLMAHYAGSGAFLLGSAFGTLISFVLIALISTNYTQEDDTRMVTILGFAIMFGILALHYRRVAIIAGTSFFGSYALVSGLDHFVKSGFNSIITELANGHLAKISHTAFIYVFIVAFVVITLLGAFIQYRQMNKFDVQLYPEELESYEAQSAMLASNPRLGFLSRILNFRKKVDEVPLLDVVSLEDY